VIKNKEITRLEHSRVKLSITIDKDAAEKEYANLLADYAKKTQLPGFRKGKVPPSILERKFGEIFKAEVAEKIIKDSLTAVFEEIEEKPLIYEAPELQEDYKITFGEDFFFAVAYDTFPKVELGPYTGLTVEKPVVKISGEDETRELEAIVEQNSFIVEKDGAAEKGDTATIDCWEVDAAGEEIANTKKQDMPLEVGGMEDAYGIAAGIAGMKKGEKKEITKTFSQDYEDKNLAGAAKKIVVQLKGLREKKRPEINDELAQDISDSYETLEDLKNDIKKRLEEAADERVHVLTVEALMEQIVEKSNVELPESMVRAEQERRWRQFAIQLRIREEDVERIFASQNTSKDQLYAEWRPGSEKTLKFQICMQKMIEVENIKTSPEELEEFFKEQAEKSSMSIEEVKTYYAKNNLTDAVRREIQEKKLFDHVLEKNTIVAGKEITYMDALMRKPAL
jgi:trigger factor